jgi:hypothetical protein
MKLPDFLPEKPSDSLFLLASLVLTSISSVIAKGVLSEVLTRVEASMLGWVFDDIRRVIDLLRPPVSYRHGSLTVRLTVKVTVRLTVKLTVR